MPTPLLNTGQHLELLLKTPRPGEEDILAYYEERLGGIGLNPRLLLLPVDDHLAHRGDGVFETIKYLEGRLYQLDHHLERMKRSASGIFLEAPLPWETIRELVLEVAEAGKARDGMMRLLLGRGPGGFGIDPAECPRSSLYIVAYRFVSPSESWYAKGLTGFRTSIPAKQGYMAHIKNANYLPNVLMTREARENGADVPFCFDERGFLAESAVANICLVDKSGRLLAPKFTNALPGTTILRAMELLKGKVESELRELNEADLLAASEVLLLGTGPDCAAVTGYQGQIIGNGKPGPVSELLRRLIRQDILEYGVPVPGLA